MPVKSHLIQYHIAAPQTEAQRVYSLQRKAYIDDPYPSYEQRLKNIVSLQSLLSENEQAIIEAVALDYGHRPWGETTLVELFGSHSGLREIKKHLKTWMKPLRRKVTLFYGGKNRVIPQPKGVVGVIVPWNYPVFMTITQVAISMAAGNRTVVKMAENSSHLRDLLHGLVKEKFDEAIFAIVPDAKGSDFSSLPFDHMLFTGSPATGKAVMAAAAQNLCSVTLELGGKSPTIVCDDFELEKAAQRIAQYKYMNAGQTCLAPDYVFVPRDKVDRFVVLVQQAANQYFPDVKDPEGYTSIIDTDSYQRLRRWLEEVKNQGAPVINLMSEDSFDDVNRKFPPHIVIDPSEDCELLKTEIFGPILPVIPYDNLDEVLRYIAIRDRPLALYLFSHDKKIQERVVYSSISGGVTINNCVVHCFQHDLPFGGAGASGMGQYHGYEGFAEFSKMRPVFKYPSYISSAILSGPYTSKHKLLYRCLNWLGL
ncbi:coniferyl-aldehyde dehydrogenase [Zhongshania antarctica]|uniref:Aldehyde dehydrogenase n=1 Tax=Zhongshania antarctica TaxID=641702 RepID=A0A840RA10_9GAMM|nr:coniferyl aldehyde dehydrogenase [Zhongshania antarctica]MBB5189263.1 coniferyl-aldehyde dehydrogenase [Zhongshania antarctica]